MSRICAILLIAFATAVVSFAPPPQAPELDPGAGMGTLVFLSGVILTLRARRK